MLVTSILRTAEFNARQEGGWYEFATENAIPESQLQSFMDEMKDAKDRHLVLADSLMFRHRRGGRGERKLRVTHGIYLSVAGLVPGLKKTGRNSVS
jgi:hypothetical protein